MIEIVCADVTRHDIDPALFDVMIADPPYSEHVHKSATSAARPGEAHPRHRDLGFVHLSAKLRGTIADFAARVRRWSLIYSDGESTHRWRQDAVEAGATYIRTVPWVRWSMPQLSGDRPPQGWEPVSLFWGSQKGKKTWSGPGNLTHLGHKCLRGEDKHKAEKPLDQMLDLVSWFTNVGDVVLDPCAGSGTVALACKLLGRSCVAYEINPEWVERANRRVDEPLSKRDQDRYDRWVANGAGANIPAATVAP